MYNEEENIKETEEGELKQKIAIEEEKIDNEISDLRKSLDDISFENQYYIKKIEGQLSDDSLSHEDRTFFEEQRETYRKLQKDLEEKLYVAESMLKKAKNDLYDRENNAVKEG